MRYNPILKPYKLLQQHHALPLWEGVLDKVLYREAPPRSPLKYHSDRKGTPFVYLLLKKYGTAFTYLV